MEQEFSQILERIQPKLEMMAKNLDGKYAYVDDQDLLQEAKISLWKKYQAGELSDKTTAWIAQACYFRMKDYVRRKERKDKFVSLSQPIGGKREESGETLTYSDVLAEKPSNPEAYRSLLMSIEKSNLSAREKEILKLMLEGGYTVREIGAKLGISDVRVSQIKKKLQIGLRKIALSVL